MFFHGVRFCDKITIFGDLAYQNGNISYPFGQGTPMDNKKRHSAKSVANFAGPISRVLSPLLGPQRPNVAITLHGPLSFIYDDALTPPPATYPPTLGEQPFIVGIHGLATHGMY